MTPCKPPLQEVCWRLNKHPQQQSLHLLRLLLVPPPLQHQLRHRQGLPLDLHHHLLQPHLQSNSVNHLGHRLGPLQLVHHLGPRVGHLGLHLVPPIPVSLLDPHLVEADT
jgi:hypothetical protein